MTSNTFMDTFTLVRNRLEKQDTRFREAFQIEKRVAIDFRSSHQRCSTIKFTGKHLCQGLRPATLLKKILWHRCFPANFSKILKTPFLQNTSGRLKFLPQRFKNICCQKIDCGKHYRLSKYFVKISENPKWNSQSNCYI